MRLGNKFGGNKFSNDKLFNTFVKKNNYDKACCND